jgi:hypothetical protein
VRGSGCIIDAGSFCVIRKKPGHPLELRYCYEKYSWSMYAISDIPGLNGDDDWSYDYTLSSRKLWSMVISIKDVQSAIEKRGKPVNLRAGHHVQNKYFWDELDGSSLSEEGTIDEAPKLCVCVKYPQVDLLEEDLMCVIKADSSGIFRHDSLIAGKIMEDYGSNIDPAKMKDIRFMLRCVGVQSDYISVTDRVFGTFFLDFVDGLFLATVVDQNGTAGHCVFIDTERKVIIDPANKK